MIVRQRKRCKFTPSPPQALRISYF